MCKELSTQHRTASASRSVGETSIISENGLEVRSSYFPRTLQCAGQWVGSTLPAFRPPTPRGTQASTCPSPGSLVPRGQKLGQHVGCLCSKKETHKVCGFACQFGREMRPPAAAPRPQHILAGVSWRGISWKLHPLPRLRASWCRNQVRSFSGHHQRPAEPKSRASAVCGLN